MDITTRGTGLTVGLPETNAPRSLTEPVIVNRCIPFEPHVSQTWPLADVVIDGRMRRVIVMPAAFEVKAPFDHDMITVGAPEKESLASVLARASAQEVGTLIDRLRGKYVIPITDGGGPLDGKDTYTRHFDNVPPIQLKAADRIETLEQALRDIRAGVDNPCTIATAALGDGKR